jgi:hypothetical protein
LPDSLFSFAKAVACESMSDAKGALSANDEWYLYLLPTRDPQVQPYRTAPTVWPLSTEELSRTERESKSGNASALNNLGTNVSRQV